MFFTDPLHIFVAAANIILQSLLFRGYLDFFTDPAFYVLRQIVDAE